MSECSLCGECCRYIPLPIKGVPKETKDWLQVRGIKEEQGFFLLEQTCGKLEMRVTDEGKTEWICSIHNTKPAICKRWKGQARIKDRRYYVPQCCSYHHKEGGVISDRNWT